MADTQAETEVAPDDEDLILNFESAIEVLSDPDRDEYADEVALAQAELDLNAAREALCRRFAELRATSLKYQLAFGDRDNDAHRLADRVAELEAALAACRDELAVHRERAANLNNMWRHEFAQKVEAAADEVFARMAWPHKETRALKTKEPTND